MLIRLRGKRPRQWITPNRDMRRVDGQILPNGEGAIWPMPGCGDYSLLSDCWRSITPGPFAMHQETSKSLETTSQVVLRRELITECWRTA